MANADGIVVAHGHFLTHNTVGMDAGELLFSLSVLCRRLFVTAFLALLTPSPDSTRRYAAPVLGYTSTDSEIDSLNARVQCQYLTSGLATWITSFPDRLRHHGTSATLGPGSTEHQRLARAASPMTRWALALGDIRPLWSSA